MAPITETEPADRSQQKTEVMAEGGPSSTTASEPKGEGQSVEEACTGTPTADDAACTLAEVRRWSPGDVALAVLSTLAVMYTLYFTRSLTFPLTLAFLLNLVMKPAVLRLNRWKVPNVVSATLVLLGFTFLLIVGSALVVEPAQRWIADAPENFAQAAEKLRILTQPLKKIQEATKQVDEMTDLGEEQEPLKVAEEPPSLATKVLNTTGGFLAGAMITIVTLFFLLAGGDRFLEKLVGLMPTWTDKRRMVELTRETQSKISSYLFTITMINIGLGVVIGTGLWLIGMPMPNPVMWGCLAAVLNYIPFAGFIVGVMLVTVVSIVTFDGLGHALLAPAIYLAANGIEANFITPALIGRSISLNPTMVVLSVFLWGWMWGVGGVLLAVPLLLVFKIFCDHSEVLAPVGLFLER